MASSRNKGLDLFRVIAMFFVVLIHIIVTLMYIYPDKDVFTLSIMAMVLGGIAKPMMGVFFMTSGAFLLGRESTMNPIPFYKKAWKKLGIPTLVISLLHLLLEPIREVIQMGMGWDGYGASLWHYFLKFLQGDVAEHLWYVLVLMGLYFLAPFIAKSREMFSEKEFSFVTICIFILGIISSQSETYTLKWSFGHVIAYVGVFMMGFELFKNINGEKNNKKAIVNILIACLIIAIEIVGCIFAKGIDIPALKVVLAFGEPYNPLNQIIAIFFFKGFVYLEPHFDVGYLSGLTYWVYLTHVLFQRFILLPVELLFKFYGKSEGISEILCLLIYSLLNYAGCMLLTHLVLTFKKNRKGKVST